MGKSNDVCSDKTGSRAIANNVESVEANCAAIPARPYDNTNGEASDLDAGVSDNPYNGVKESENDDNPSPTINSMGEDETPNSSFKSPPYTKPSKYEEIPNGCAENFPYRGIISTAYLARLHQNPTLGIGNTLADIPKGTHVEVIGAEQNMRKVQVDPANFGMVINKKGAKSTKSSILTGYVSQELVRPVSAQKDFCEDHPYADSEKLTTSVPDHLLPDKKQFHENEAFTNFHIDGNSFSEELITSLIKKSMNSGDSNTPSKASIKFNLRFGLVGELLKGGVEGGGGFIIGLGLNCAVGDSRAFSASVEQQIGAYGEISAIWGLIDAKYDYIRANKQTISTSTIEKFSAIIVQKVTSKVLELSKIVDAEMRAIGTNFHLTEQAEKLHKDNLPKNRKDLSYTTVESNSRAHSGELSDTKGHGGYNYKTIKTDEVFKNGDKSRKSTTEETSHTITAKTATGQKFTAQVIDKKVINHANSDYNGTYRDFVFDFILPAKSFKRVQEELKNVGTRLVTEQQIIAIMKNVIQKTTTENSVVIFQAAAKATAKFSFVVNNNKQTFLNMTFAVGLAASFESEEELPIANILVAGARMKAKLGASFDNERLIFEQLGTDTLAYLSLVHNGLMGRAEVDKPQESWEQFKSKHRSSLNEMVNKIRTGELDINQFSSRSLDHTNFNLEDLETVLDEMQSYKNLNSM